VLGWLLRLFGIEKRGTKRRRRTSSRSASSKPRLVTKDEEAPAEAEAAPKLPVLQNLDGPEHRSLPVAERDREMLERITSRIDRGDFDLPHLPATGMALVNLAGKPGVDVSRVIELISSDPSLASQLLRTANSVLYATRMPAETLNEAVMRIGLRGLRSLVFTVSVKGTILRLKRLERFSHEIWRQAFSVGSIARSIAPLVGEDRERAFLVGLLHDVGKIALLSMLSKDQAYAEAASPAMVGHLFYVHHEHAGAVLARKWRLDEELASVAGCHHNYKENEDHGRIAAIASLAHKLDLHLSLDDLQLFKRLAHCQEMEFLGIPEGRRAAILAAAQQAYDENGAENSGEMREAG